MKDSDKMLSHLEVAKRFKHEKSEKGKLARWVIRMCREIRRAEKQKELNIEANKALQNFKKGKITKEELDQKILPLELILKKAMKKAVPKIKRR
jgi:hypothetical protein